MAFQFTNSTATSSGMPSNIPAGTALGTSCSHASRTRASRSAWRVGRMQSLVTATGGHVPERNARSA